LSGNQIQTPSKVSDKMTVLITLVNLQLRGGRVNNKRIESRAKMTVPTGIQTQIPGFDRQPDTNTEQTFGQNDSPHHVIQLAIARKKREQKRVAFSARMTMLTGIQTQIPAFDRQQGTNTEQTLGQNDSPHHISQFAVAR